MLVCSPEKADRVVVRWSVDPILCLAASPLR